MSDTTTEVQNDEAKELDVTDETTNDDPDTADNTPAEDDSDSQESADTDEQDVEEDSEPVVEEDSDDSDDDQNEADEQDDIRSLLAKNRRVNREARNLRARVKAAELTALQYEAAAETGLPLTAAKRLQGKDLESLKKDAETLKELLGVKTQPPKLDPTPQDGVSRGDRRDADVDYSAIGARMFKR